MIIDRLEKSPEGYALIDHQAHEEGQDEDNRNSKEHIDEGDPQGVPEGGHGKDGCIVSEADEFGGREDRVFGEAED